MVAAILINRPARLVLDTSSQEAATEVECAVSAIRANVLGGKTTYQTQHNLGNMPEIDTKIMVKCANVANKRQQVVHG